MLELSHELLPRLYYREVLHIDTHAVIAPGRRGVCGASVMSPPVHSTLKERFLRLLTP